MECGSLSVVAERGQKQLEGTIAAARNVLSHFATDLSPDSERNNDRQLVGPDGEFNIQSFLAAKDVYLACSRGLRETIRDIGARRKDSGSGVTNGWDHPQDAPMDDSDVEEARSRVQELRKRVWERNLTLKSVMDELITLLDDLNMADSVSLQLVKEDQ
eukprot:jgi/Botrbrau1/7372/Bobra.0316s0016.1